MRFWVLCGFFFKACIRIYCAKTKHQINVSNVPWEISSQNSVSVWKPLNFTNSVKQELFKRNYLSMYWYIILKVNLFVCLLQKHTNGHISSDFDVWQCPCIYKCGSCRHLFRTRGGGGPGKTRRYSTDGYKILQSTGTCIVKQSKASKE